MCKITQQSVYYNGSKYYNNDSYPSGIILSTIYSHSFTRLFLIPVREVKKSAKASLKEVSLILETGRVTFVEEGKEIRSLSLGW